MSSKPKSHRTSQTKSTSSSRATSTINDSASQSTTTGSIAATSRATSSTPPPPTLRSEISSKLEVITKRNSKKDDEELELKRKLVPRLAKRAYHLEEGNTWWDDWVQYQKNTHPVFGLCFYHRLHPIRFPQRVIILIGSIAFGFAITNCVYMGFLGDENTPEAVNTIYDAAGKAADFQQSITHLEIQQSMVFLITVGAFVHSAYDMLVWYLMACFCFRPGGGFRVNKYCQTIGIYIAVLAVLLAIVVATFFVIVRLDNDVNAQEEYDASMAEKLAEDLVAGRGGGNADGTTSTTTTSTGAYRFSFLVGYAIELVVALFIFYFFTSTVFFSGILGCGRLPILGGRPYELWREQKRNNNANANDEDKSSMERFAPGLEAYWV